MMIFWVVFFLIFTVIAFYNLRWGIFIILAALPSYLIRFQVLRIPMTMLEVMILMIFLVWLFKNFQFPPTTSKVLDGIGTISNFQQNVKCQMSKIKDQWLLFFFISLFLLSATIGMFVSSQSFDGTLPNLREAAGIWKAYFIEPILFFIVLISEFRKNVKKSDFLGKSDFDAAKNFKFIVSALGISAFYISICAILQRFFGVPIPAPWQAEMRVTSIFPYPNAVGLFLAPLIPLFFYQIIFNFKFLIFNQFLISKFLNLFSWSVVMILSILSIYFAKTEAALAALAAGLFFFLLFYNNKTRLILVLLFLCFSVSLFLFGDSFSAIKDKLLLKDWSGMTRITMWSETWQMLKDRPIFGAGLSGYQTAILSYHKAQWMEVFLYPHNIIFNFWSEIGLLGLLSFAAIVVLFFWNLRIWNLLGNWKLSRFHRGLLTLSEEIGNYDGTKINRVVFLAIASSMIALLVHGLVDVPYFKNDLSVLFWLIVGLTIVSRE